MKNKLKYTFLIKLFLMLVCESYSIANDVLIDAKEIDIQEKGNLIIASGSVNITDGKSISIRGNNAKYNKSDQTLEINKNVVLTDNENNYTLNSGKIFLDRKKEIITSTKSVILEDQTNNYKLISEKIVYFKSKQIVKSYGETKIFLSNDLVVSTNNITFNNNLKLFTTTEKTFAKDDLNNRFELSSFNYDLKDKIFKADKIKFVDAENNTLSLNNGFINLKLREIIGSDFIFKFNNKLFGNKENEPRIIGRYVATDKSETKMKKSIFTTCKKIEGKCPAWSISADEVVHNKERKRIEYKNAWLDIYDVPVAYFPYFFHPDPSVKRQSGFLFPQFINSSNLGFSTQLPYYVNLDNHKDMTISPRIYSNNNLFLQTEYRQVFKNSNLITDISFNNKENSNSHFFANLKGDFENSFYQMKIETVSNDAYLKKYQIKSPLIDSYSTLNSSFIVESLSENSSFYSSIDIIEDLTKSNNDKYEYIFPNFEFTQDKYLNNNFFETMNYKSSGSYRKFNTNVDELDFINDIVLQTNNFEIIDNAESNLKFLIRNLNTYGNLSNTIKEDETYAVKSAFVYNLKYPLIKEKEKNTSFLSPIASLRYSPNKGLNLKNEETIISFEDLFNLDRINNKTIEEGGSLTLGLEYINQEKNTFNENLKFGLGVNLRTTEDKDLPLSSSLNQKTSDIIGYSGINITENLSLNYNFSVDNNLSETNYSLISANYNTDRLKTRFEYMEKSNFIGDESYLTNFTELLINKSNSVSFETSKNVDKDITNYYDLIYSYYNDCLKASVVYNRQFYEDKSINSDQNIFFKISFIPFGTINTPNIND